MTIEQIAKELGLSISTVSKAFNNATDVSQSTRKRVVDYANEIGFSMKKKIKEVNRLCVFLSNINDAGNSYVSYTILNSFKEASQRFKYEVVVENVHNHSFDFDNYMSANNIAGALIIGHMSEIFNAQLSCTTFPTVLLDTYVENHNIASISLDNIYAMRGIITHLSNFGHKDILLLNGPKHSAMYSERLAGYIIGLSANQIDYCPNKVVYTNGTEQAGMDIVQKIIDSNVTAVACANDSLAIGLIRALSKKGIAVPERISVTGFDDIELGKYLTPSLTTVHQDFSFTGEKAFYLIRQLINGYAPQRIVINGKLVERESSGSKAD